MNAYILTPPTSVPCTMHGSRDRVSEEQRDRETERQKDRDAHTESQHVLRTAEPRTPIGSILLLLFYFHCEKGKRIRLFDTKKKTRRLKRDKVENEE
jgi:hypothetical protein